MLEELLPFSTAFDATLLIEWEPQEFLSKRLKQKLQLSRHGHVDFHSWEHRDIRELVEAHEALTEMVEREHEASK